MASLFECYWLIQDHPFFVEGLFLGNTHTTQHVEQAIHFLSTWILFHVGNNSINTAFLIKCNKFKKEVQLIFLIAQIINLEVLILVIIKPNYVPSNQNFFPSSLIFGAFLFFIHFLNYLHPPVNCLRTPGLEPLT